MKFLGIHWAPIDIPLDRRLQVLSVYFAIVAFIGLGFFCTFVMVCLLFTRYFFIPIFYATWVAYDRNICVTGGRMSEGMRDLKWWKYYRDYFPLQLVKTVELDPSRNYLLCCFPHGIVCSGAFGSFTTNALNYKETFPGITTHMITLHTNFFIPGLRELALSMGMCSSSKESLQYILTKPGGGNAVTLLVGGALEAQYAHPGCYIIVLKKRKGFVKAALKSGASLVPVFSFGETDLFDQPANPEGSFVRKLQDTARKTLGFVPILMLGRGLLQYSFGFVPRRRPVTTVVGEPIHVEKTSVITDDMVEVLHQEFMKRLVELFEKHKEKYLDSRTELTIV